MRLYDDEDNAPMNDDFLLEYTAILNEKLFRETGILEITTRAEDPPNMYGKEGLRHY